MLPNVSFHIPFAWVNHTHPPRTANFCAHRRGCAGTKGDPRSSPLLAHSARSVGRTMELGRLRISPWRKTQDVPHRAVRTVSAILPKRSFAIHRLQIALLLVSLNLIGGCSVLQESKLLAAGRFGLTPVTPRIYVEAGADEATQLKLRDAMEKAEGAIRAAYGSVNSRPIVHACVSEGCYRMFGGRGSIAKIYGDRILLSPRGLNWHFLAHEWSHAEMRSRLTVRAWWHMPQWFDEGVAVVVSEAPEHSEDHWQLLIATNAVRPTREELHTFKSLSQWLDAVRRYGEDKNIERKAKGEPELRPVYSAAGHELRPWLTNVGSHGLLAFIERLNDGEDFERAYQTANIAAAVHAPRNSP